MELHIYAEIHSSVSVQNLNYVWHKHEPKNFIASGRLMVLWDYCSTSRTHEAYLCDLLFHASMCMVCCFSHCCLDPWLAHDTHMHIPIRTIYKFSVILLWIIWQFFYFFLYILGVFSYSWIVLLQSVWHIFSLLIQSSNIILIRYYPTFLTLRLLYFVEISIDDEQWNDGLLATIREKVRILKHPILFPYLLHMQ
jgi:hypothetical protein